MIPRLVTLKDMPWVAFVVCDNLADPLAQQKVATAVRLGCTRVFYLPPTATDDDMRRHAANVASEVRA